MTLHLMRDRFVRPVRRATLVVLAWTYRHTLKLWARSLLHELRRPEPFDGARLRTLASALLRVSADPLSANAPEIRRLRIDGDVVHVDVDDGWPAGHVLLTTNGQTIVSRVEPVAAASSGV